MGPPAPFPADLQKYEYNPDKASRCSPEAGWDPNQVVKIQWIPGIRDRDATVQIVQGQLQAVGMKVELNPLEAGPLVENHKNRTFDLSLYGGGLYTIDGDSTSVPNQCDQAYPAGGNNAHYCNAEVDAAFAARPLDVRSAQRNQAYQQFAHDPERRSAVHLAVRPECRVGILRQAAELQAARRVDVRLLERQRVAARAVTPSRRIRQAACTAGSSPPA